VPLVDQDMFTLPEHLSSPMVFNEVRVSQSSIFHVVVGPSISVFFFPFSFDHCINYLSFFELLLLILKLFFTKQLQDISAVNIYNSDKFIIFIFETQNRTQARLYQHTHAHFVLLTSDEMWVKRSADTQISKCVQ
jgi:hypothetical protein